MTSDRQVPLKILFIGAGRMAGAMVKGLLAQSDTTPGDHCCMCGPDDSGQTLAKQTGIRHTLDLREGAAGCTVIVLACKPQQLKDLPGDLAGQSKDKLVVSILAGIPLSRLEEAVPQARNIVRVMPNTPGQLGEGVSAYAPLHTLSATDLSHVRQILAALGTFLEVPEGKLDAVTALSGSGPAYVFEFTEALARSGEALGLSPDEADQLARRTVIGSAALLRHRESTRPEELRDEVTSPGGTTEAALRSLGESDFRAILAKALAAAEARSVELSRI